MHETYRQREKRSDRTFARLPLSLITRATLVTCALALGVGGCTKTPQKPPKSQLLQAKKDDRSQTEHQQEIERQHVAPPPAYGNKVVMAEGETSPQADF